MNFTAEHRDWASTIATFFAKKDSNDATQMSNLFVLLWNAVGSQNAVNLIWHYTTQIRVGINATYPGVNMFNKGSIHPMKQKFVNTLYKRLVREMVMPIIHQFFKDEVKPGAFVSTLVIPEDMTRLQGVVEYDQSAAVEINLRQLISNVKYRPGTANSVTEALRQGTFDNLEIVEEEDVEAEEDLLNQNHLANLDEVELQLEEEQSPPRLRKNDGVMTVGRINRHLRHRFEDAIAPGAPVRPRRAREQSPPPRPRKRVYRRLDLVDDE